MRPHLLLPRVVLPGQDIDDPPSYELICLLHTENLSSSFFVRPSFTMSSSSSATLAVRALTKHWAITRGQRGLFREGRIFPDQRHPRRKSVSFISVRSWRAASWLQGVLFVMSAFISVCLLRLPCRISGMYRYRRVDCCTLPFCSSRTQRSRSVCIGKQCDRICCCRVSFYLDKTWVDSSLSSYVPST